MQPLFGGPTSGSATPSSTVSNPNPATPSAPSSPDAGGIVWRRGFQREWRPDAPYSACDQFCAASGQVDAIRAAPPLPETADEICAVGQVLGAQPNDILIGARSNERALAALNASGALRSYRIIHFATHGLLASETAAIAPTAAEPALLLTPPDTASEDDDGVLTASEITRFDLAAELGDPVGLQHSCRGRN